MILSENIFFAILTTSGVKMENFHFLAQNRLFQQITIFEEKSFLENFEILTLRGVKIEKFSIFNGRFPLLRILNTTTMLTCFSELDMLWNYQ